MKRLIYIILPLLMLLSLERGTAQSVINTDLAFKDSFALPKNRNIQMNKVYDLYITIKNQGTDFFAGSIAFHAGVYSSERLIDFTSLKSTFCIDSNDIPFYAIPPGDEITIRKRVRFTDKYFKPDTSNIVIIWPSGKNKPYSNMFEDLDVTNNYTNPFHRLNILSNGKPVILGSIPSIKEEEGNSDKSFISFPNPADNVINIINYHNQNGFITVRDLNGRAVLTKNMYANEDKIQLPLRSETSTLKEGFYFLQIETKLEKYHFKFLVKH